MRKTLKRLLQDTRGNFVEYLTVTGLVALVGAAGYATFGTGVKDTIGKASSTVTGVNTSIAYK